MLNFNKFYITFMMLFMSYSLFAKDNYTNIISTINHELTNYERLATNSKNNEHYQPYIISILKSDTFAKLGFTTLGDALKIIPGVAISSDNMNNKALIFRGSNPTSFGQSKLLIDGILVNNIYVDAYSEYLDMPIELIKRIEVIRGPGNESSSITSYVGSINIITFAGDLETDGLFFSKVGSNNYKSIGFRKGYKKEDFSLFTDFFYKKHKNSVHVESSALKAGMYNFPLPIDNTALSTPSDVSLGLENYSLGLNIKYKDILFKSRVYEYKQRSAFGVNFVPSNETDYLELPNYYSQLQYKKLFKLFCVDTKIGIKYNNMENKAKVLPDGIVLPQHTDPTLSVTFNNGVYSEILAKQRAIYHSTKLKYNGIKNHNISTSYYISKTDTINVVSKLTNRDTGVGIVDYSQTIPFFDNDATRKTYNLSIDDKYSYSSALQFLSSLSYENNTHIKAKINPKFSLVYHTEVGNIIKLLYALSHRTPSWQELYMLNNHSRVGNKNLKAEEIETFEASYIKHFSHDSFFQTSLFHIINKNQIHNMTINNQYVNSDTTNKINGIELEYKGNLTPKDSLYLNLSYIDGENSYDDTLSGASNLLLKGYYIYNLRENLALSTVVKYSSDKDRVNLDTRENISATTIVDATVSYKNFSNDYQISLSIKNLFDKDIFYASKINTYEDDYPEIGRNFILSYSKKF